MLLLAIEIKQCSIDDAKSRKELENNAFAY